MTCKRRGWAAQAGLGCLLVVALVLVGGLTGCSGRAATSGQGGSEQLDLGQVAGEQQIPQLGVVGQPSPDPRGLLVKSFAPPPDRSPLELMGVRENDIVLSCNGVQEQIRPDFVKAVEGLQQRGEPITLVVQRGGTRVTLKRSEKLPKEAVPDVPGPDTPVSDG